ncbi:MAG: bifunctional hydroxymethylpyrimidine kinase/phosphomethylpyrimidine kinase [Rikenellaceae bacterium]|nr:bifunctional hydroxymethylpyrimidine kinase/phosphomethylpyrimidine kinase [Rikenellaceae bacterium]
MKTKIMMTIAGSDSSAGAGIQADMKSAFAAGVYCTTVITSLTAQNTCGVRAIETASADMVASQMDAVLDDMDVTAVKCGMLPSEDIVRVVSVAASQGRLPQLVVDPVMVATSGDRLIDDAAAQAVITELLPHTMLVTPNIPEVYAITGIRLDSSEGFDLAAGAFRALGCKAVLIKAGHLSGALLVDRLYDFVTGDVCDFSFPRIETPNTHGTGCSLSSAITARLSAGAALRDAVAGAEEFIHRAIDSGRHMEWGGGHGPINHFIR